MNNSVANYPPYRFRLNQLKKLKSAIEAREGDIMEALYLDMKKPDYEAYTSEIGLVYRELNDAIKNLHKWMRDERVLSPIYIQPARSFRRATPKGLVLIISPWNYPFLLTMSPLIGAMAAGNKLIIKPSNKSRHTSQVIAEIIGDNFHESYISTRLGPGSQVVEGLMKEYKFQHIFFTGSQSVGKKVLTQAAEQLIPVTLELGGKSPAIVDSNSDIDQAARKIVWAKFFNLGQTCIAPDYALVDSKIYDEFLSSLKKYILEFYGGNISENPDYGRIIDLNRFQKLMGLIDRDKILYGGENKKEDLFIGPTIVEADLEDDIMQEEIFGPILPLIKCDSRREVYKIVNRNPYPLAFYLFTKDQDLIEDSINHIPFGGGCINDTMSHMINTNMPFGGVRYSGMGSYHGKKSFQEFSHYKSIVESKTRFDLRLKYPPYSKSKLKWTRKFLR